MRQGEQAAKCAQRRISQGRGEPLKTLPEGDRGGPKQTRRGRPRCSTVDLSSRQSRSRGGPMSAKARAAAVAENPIGSAPAVLDAARRQTLFSTSRAVVRQRQRGGLESAFSVTRVSGSKGSAPMQKRQASRRPACALIGFAATAIRQQLLEVHPGPLCGSLASDQDSDLAGLGPLCRAEEHRGSVRPWCDFNDTQAESFDRKPGMWVYL